MTKKSIFLIIPDGFRDEEYQIPKDIFEQNGIKVYTASSVKGILKGKLGQVTASVDVLIEDIKVNDYDLIVIIGGGRTFWNDSSIIELIKQANDNNKIIGAICSSAVLPAQAGLLTGKPGTAYPGEPEIEEMEKYGVIYQGKTVEVSNNIVTANGPDAAKDFAEKLLELSKKNATEQITT